MSLDSSQLASLLRYILNSQKERVMNDRSLIQKSVISEENTSTQTFEAIANSFHQFFNKQDFFKIGCALVTLLQNKDLIVHPTQRIVCIFFLYDMYRNDPIALNPFACVFNYLVIPPNQTQNGIPKDFHWSIPRLTPQEKFFVSQLITSPSKELFKKTATQILQMDPANLHSVDVSGLQISLAEKLSELPHVSKVGMPCILSDAESSRYGYDDNAPRNGSEHQKNCIETLLVGSEAPFRKCIKPEFIRLAPPLHVAKDELIWLDPIDYTPQFAWDTTLLNTTTTSSNTSEIRKLLAKACRSQLNINQQQMLESALLKDSNIISYIDFTPDKFANVVELNPLIAVKMILAYQYSEASDLSSYLEELLKIKMSVHSMEVVNNLAQSVILPDEFLHLYISTCISKCESMTDDKNLQNRLVRLLCVFIQSLIKNRLIDVKELHIELQPFCMEFSAIKDASALYRLLKSINNENNSYPSTTTSTTAQNNTTSQKSSGSTVTIPKK